MENSSRPDDKRPGVFKNSYHLYFVNVYFENNADTCMRPFVKRYLDLSDPALTISESAPEYDLNKETPLIVDMTVYTKHRQFRLLGSHKATSNQRVALPSFELFEKISMVGKTCPPEGMLVTCAMMSIVPGQTEKLKEGVRQHIPRELADKYRDEVCSRIKELLRLKGDVHTDVYMQDARYVGKTDAQYGRKCLVAGEHNESDNCFFSIRENGQVYYHCFDDEAHDRNASVCIGELVPEEETKDSAKLKSFVDELPSCELQHLASLLPDTCHDLIQVQKASEEKASVGKASFSVQGLCDRCESSHIELDKGAFWTKCECSVNYSFFAWHFDPTHWSNDDFRLHGYDAITTQYNERYAQPFNIGKETRVHFNANPMGAGKTEQLKKFFSFVLNGERPDNYTEEMLESLKRFMIEGEATRTLCIGPRITFDEQLQVRMAEVGLAVRLYLDIEHREDPDFMIYQFESIYKIAGKKPFTIVVMDEVESVLTQVTAGLNKNHARENIAAFEATLRAADLVICLDAFLSKKTVEVITAIVDKPPSRHDVREKTATIHCNTYRDHMKREYFIHKSGKSIKNQLKLSLAQGNRLAIVVGTQRQGAKIVNKILRQLPNLRYRFYHRDDKQKNRPCEHLADFKKNLNEIWNSLDVVIYTSKLTVGADFSIEDHFDQLFMFMDLDKISVRDYMQMSGRVRHVPVVHAFVSKPFEAETAGLTLDDMKHRLQNKQDAIVSTEREYMQLRMVLMNKKFEWRYTEDWLFKLMAYNKLEESLTKSRMLQCFIWYIKEQGGTFSLTDQEHTPMPANVHDWSRNNDPSPEEALEAQAEAMEAEAQEVEEELQKDREIEKKISTMSPLEKEARIQQLTDEGVRWNKEKSLLEFTVIFPDAKPTFQSQKMVSKQRTRISNMAVFLKKDLPELRVYEHRDGPLDALLDADEFLFTRLALIKDLFKVMRVNGFETDVDGSLIVENGDQITAILKKAVGLFEGIKLQRVTKRVLGIDGTGTLSLRQIAGLVQQLLKSFLYCEFKVALTDDNKPKRIKKNGTKYSVYQILPSQIAGVRIDVLAGSSKFASGQRKRSQEAESDVTRNKKRKMR